MSSNSSSISTAFGTSRRPNVLPLTFQKYHGRVGTSHELNVHCFPRSRGIRVPSNVARSTLIIHFAGTRLSGVGVGAHDRESGNKSGQKDRCKHIYRRRVKNEDAWGAAGSLSGQKYRNHGMENYVHLMEEAFDGEKSDRRSGRGQGMEVSRMGSKGSNVENVEGWNRERSPPALTASPKCTPSGTGAYHSLPTSRLMPATRRALVR